MKETVKNVLLFLFGGGCYYLLELLWRGYSHWSMFLLGGLCFFLCGQINEVLSWEVPLPIQMLFSTCMITLLEFCVGVLVNLYLGWEIWDYSEHRFHFLGQISLKSSMIWFFLSAVGIILDDWVRYHFLGEKKPRYRLW